MKTVSLAVEALKGFAVLSCFVAMTGASEAAGTLIDFDGPEYDFITPDKGFTGVNPSNTNAIRLSDNRTSFSSVLIRDELNLANAGCLESSCPFYPTNNVIQGDGTRESEPFVGVFDEVVRTVSVYIGGLGGAGVLDYDLFLRGYDVDGNLIAEDTAFKDGSVTGFFRLEIATNLGIKTIEFGGADEQLGRNSVYADSLFFSSDAVTTPINEVTPGPDTNVVPLPAGMPLLLGGMALLAALNRRRNA